MIQWTEDGGEIPFSAGGAMTSSQLTSSHRLDMNVHDNSFSRDHARGVEGETIEVYTQRENHITASTNDHDYKATALTAALSSKSSMETGSWSFSIDGAGGGKEKGESSSSYSSMRLETTRKITSSVVALGITSSTVWQTLSFEQTVERAWSSSARNDVGGTPVTRSKLFTTSFTTSGSTTGSTTASAGGGGAGTPLYTTTTSACTHSGSTTQTSTFTRTQISASEGAPVTTTVTVTDLTTLVTSYTVEGVGLTELIGESILAGHWERTIVQADCGRHLFAALQRTSAGIGLAHSFYSLEGTRLTLSPDFYSRTAVSNQGTDGVTTESSSTLITTTEVVDGNTFKRTTSAWETHGTASSIAMTYSALVADYQTGFPVRNPFAPTWYFDLPLSGEAGELTLNLAGPATISLTLVPGGTVASSTTTFSAAEGETASTVFPSGVAVFASGCLAGADEFSLNNNYPYNAIEVACFEGWLPQCS